MAHTQVSRIFKPAAIAISTFVGRSGDVRRSAHFRPPAGRGNARLCAEDRQGMRLVPREQIGRRCPYLSRQGFPEEKQIVLRRA